LRNPITAPMIVIRDANKECEISRQHGCMDRKKAAESDEFSTSAIHTGRQLCTSWNETASAEQWALSNNINQRTTKMCCTIRGVRTQISYQRVARSLTITPIHGQYNM